MKIECIATFLDGTIRYEAGDVRSVEDAAGAHFCSLGWAKDITGKAHAGEAETGDASLVIDNSTLGSASTNL